MIPHTAPPIYPEPVPLGRFAGAILRASSDLLDLPDPAAEIRKCKLALLGVPDDTGIAMNHGRMGAREGPHAFRQSLARYGVAVPMNPANTAAPYPRVFDAGDVIPAEDIQQTHQRVTDATNALLDLGLFPVMIGGGHDLTYPFVASVAQRQGPLSVHYLDAHLDVRAQVGSGMPFRKLVEQGHARALTITGADPLVNTQEHADWFTQHGGRFYPDPLSQREPFTDPQRLSAPQRDETRPSHLSIDLDVLDASHAPGVSALNPNGLSPAQVSACVAAAGANPVFVSFDIMELSPPHDDQQRTARIAAHLFLTFLRAFAARTR